MKKKNESRGEDQLDVSLMGDFNFPPSVVQWEKSDEGLFPHVHDGDNDSQKEGCRILVDLMNRFSLTQIVDKRTRERNTLDLVITDNPHAYSSCKTESMKPITDHRLITLTLTTAAPTHRDSQINKDLPEPATFNYYRADKAKVKAAIKSLEWKKRLFDNDRTKDIKTIKLSLVHDFKFPRGIVVVVK